MKPSLVSKYQVGQRIEVYPFRIMDFGCFATTTDGLSGLLHNSEMPSVLQANLPELIEKAVPLHVKINKFDRRTGEIAFTLEDKETVGQTASPATPAASTASAADASAEATVAPETVSPSTASTEQTEEKPVEANQSDDLVPFQFTTSQPVFQEPAKDAYTERMDQETADIQKFLETVIRQPLSPAATKVLRELLEQTSIFRFTYTMQTVVDDFEPDPGLQLLTAIERALQTQKK